MIKYQLRCAGGHGFEGWFSSMADYDRQAEAASIACPCCASTAVSKAIMAPAVATGRDDRAERLRAVMADAAGRARAYVERHFDYVGEKFPEEARAIHYGEKEERRIYGEASGAEVKALLEEGVRVAPLPGPAPTETSGETPSLAPTPAKTTLN
jgi:hypothetical protein